jgi:hypothetical protein
MKRALAIAIALGASSAGCTISTTTVQVKDPAPVTVETLDGKPLITPESTGDALAAKGSYWEPFHEVDYAIWAKRDGDALTLECSACSTPSVTMLDASGRTDPTWSWRVNIEPKQVTVSYEDKCLQPKRHGFCDASAPVRLAIPRDDVIEVRRRVEPIRPIGYVYAGLSAIVLGSLAVVAIKDHDAAPIAGLAAIPFAGFEAFGLWEIFAPVKEEAWTP